MAAFLTFAAFVSFALNFKTLYGYIDSYSPLEANEDQCNYSFQSPINIPFSELADCSAHGTNQQEIYLDITFREDFQNEFVVQNDGYTIEVVPFESDDSNPKHIEQLNVLYENYESIYNFSNPLSVTVPHGEHTQYCFDSLHFHWGKNNSYGSEHTFNGNALPIEAHLLAYSCDYSDVGAAINAFATATAKDKYVIGVVGVLFELGDPNPAIDQIVNPSIVDREMIYDNDIDNLIQYNYAQLNISDLIPGYSLDNPNQADRAMVMYYGSLTTPPCYETIRWFVMKKPLTISQAQLDQFRRFLNEYNESAADNWRPINPLNNRTLYNCEYQILDEKYVAASAKSNTITIIIVIVCVAVAIVSAVIICWYFKIYKKDDNDDKPHANGKDTHDIETNVNSSSGFSSKTLTSEDGDNTVNQETKEVVEKYIAENKK